MPRFLFIWPVSKLSNRLISIIHNSRVPVQILSSRVRVLIICTRVWGQIQVPSSSEYYNTSINTEHVYLSTTTIVCKENAQLIRKGNLFRRLRIRVSQKKTTFEMYGSHPLKSFLLLSYYTRKNFSLTGDVLGVPHIPWKLSALPKNGYFCMWLKMSDECLFSELECWTVNSTLAFDMK